MQVNFLAKKPVEPDKRSTVGAAVVSEKLCGSHIAIAQGQDSMIQK